MTPTPAVLAFDVNETLLDLTGLDPLFEEVLGDRGRRVQWFTTMLQLSFVGGLTGSYVDFTTAQRAALRMIAAQAGRTLADTEVDEVVEAMSWLPAHPDVAPALDRLRSGDFRLVALTNSVLAVARAQLAHAGLAEHFEEVFSADEVRSLKPTPEPYRMVADRCGVPVGAVCLVAAHAWDVSGALAAGCQAAFVGRSGQVPSPIGPPPQFVGDDLTEVAAGLLALPEGTGR
jgi:2-haloacid dehalogenase